MGLYLFLVNVPRTYSSITFGETKTLYILHSTTLLQFRIRTLSTKNTTQTWCVHSSDDDVRREKVPVQCRNYMHPWIQLIQESVRDIGPVCVVFLCWVRVAVRVYARTCSLFHCSGATFKLGVLCRYIYVMLPAINITSVFIFIRIWNDSKIKLTYSINKDTSQTFNWVLYNTNNMRVRAWLLDVLSRLLVIY